MENEEKKTENDTLKEQYESQIEDLKEMYNKTISEMKEMYENRIKQAKDDFTQQIKTILSSGQTEAKKTEVSDDNEETEEEQIIKRLKIKLRRL